MRRKEINRPQPPWLDRPSDRWVCGHADEGHPCAHGPDPSGGCPASGPCRPIQLDDRWKCSRPACLGGGCESGPRSDGVCGQQPSPCIPRISWHYRRRQLLLGGTAAAVAVLCLMIAVRWQEEPLRPGPLHRSHAQILGGQLASDRCGACHPAARGSLLNWFVQADSQHSGVSQSQLCMDCHHVKIDRTRATLAHNLSLEELRLVRQDNAPPVASWHDRLPSPEFGTTTAQCNACHREHQGPGHSLTAMTNHQCQTCHQDRFSSFAADHPDWTKWPYGRGGAIAFDHTRHATKHFATAGRDGQTQRFDCRRCHEVTSGGEIARSGNFESSCAACHDDSLRLEAAEGVELLALPALPRPPESYPDWPPDAVGYYDGQIGAFTQLLISAQSDVRAALAELPGGMDFAKINPDEPRQAAAAQTVARAIAALADDVAANSDHAISERLTRVGVSPATATRIAAELSPQLVYDARQRWFGTPPQKSPLGASASSEPRIRLVAGDDLLLLPMQEDDLLLEQPATGTTEGDTTDDANNSLSRSEFDVTRALPGGGWYQDDRRFAIRYRGRGHADPTLMAVVAAASEVPEDSPIAARLWENRAVAACVACHSKKTLRSERGNPWLASRRDPSRKSFTRFSHQPHFNLPILADCTHCHQLRNPAASIRLASNPDQPPEDFLPLGKAACAACHTKQAAGDRCTQCHNYHITP